jgi:peptide/nickel transport system substrate-binding protein
VGDVADSWTVAKDGLTYTFKLKKGVKFHDGSTLSSEDIKAT